MPPVNCLAIMSLGGWFFGWHAGELIAATQELDAQTSAATCNTPAPRPTLSALRGEPSPWLALGILVPNHILDNVVNQPLKRQLLDREIFACLHLSNLPLGILAVLVSGDNAALVLANAASAFQNETEDAKRKVFRVGHMG